MYSGQKTLWAMSCVIIIMQLSGCSLVGSRGASQSLSNEAKTIQVKANDLGARVARWQVEQIENDNYNYIAKRYHNASSDPRGWIQGAFYIGLTRWTETVWDKALIGHISAMAKEQKYAIRTHKPLHADEHAIGQTYLWLTEQTGSQKAYKDIQRVFDRILDDPPTVGLELNKKGKKRYGYEGACQDRWCWADALFMSPRVWLQLSNVTGDPKYFEYADKELWATVDYLFSDEYGLFFRDSRYFDLKSDNGEPVFWSRGNGWVFAALPLIIDQLPENHPSKARYLALYKKNAASLINLQADDGYWPASLRDPNKVKTPETSGTGFITFGLAWGVNNGILTDDKSKQVVLKGWNALTRAVQKNGRVNWVQQVGKAPDPVKKTDTQLYGAGAVLLAASEMTKWTGN